MLKVKINLKRPTIICLLLGGTSEKLYFMWRENFGVEISTYSSLLRMSSIRVELPPCFQAHLNVSSTVSYSGNMIELMVGEDSSKLTIIGMTLIVLTACFVARCVYDLFFHPLRKFPGPKLAAIWYFYEFYYDVIKDGTYLWEIEKMHRRYGIESRLLCRYL